MPFVSVECASDANSTSGMSIGFHFRNAKIPQIVAEAILFGGADGLNQVPKIIFRDCHAGQDFAGHVVMIVSALVNEQQHGLMLLALNPRAKNPSGIVRVGHTDPGNRNE
jgi:hypothetical protein